MSLSGWHSDKCQSPSFPSHSGFSMPRRSDRWSCTAHTVRTGGLNSLCQPLRDQGLAHQANNCGPRRGPAAVWEVNRRRLMTALVRSFMQ
jgi:hypothetical protein